MAKVTKLPNSKTIEFGGLTLNLRLSGRNILKIEKRLGKSLIAIFMSSSGGMTLPPANELLLVLQGANETSNIKESDLIDAFETFLDDGQTTMDLFEIVQELLEEAGFFGKKETEKPMTDGESLTLEAEVVEVESEL